MSIEKAREYLKKYNLDNRIKEFEVSSATVELAAKALNCIEARIAKTLSFKVNDEIILVVTSGDVRVDNKKFKEYFHSKARMLKSEEVEFLTGHKIGGVCPFGVNEDVKIYLDNSMKRFNTLYPACGSSNSAIELSIDEMEKYIKYIAWIDVCS